MYIYIYVFKADPKKYIKNEDLFFTMMYLKCVLSIFIDNIDLQNTDFGVLQKSSKQFLISIFFPPAEGDNPLPAPPPPGTSCLEQQLPILFTILWLKMSIFICNIALQNTDFGVLQNTCTCTSKRLLISIWVGPLRPARHFVYILDSTLLSQWLNQHFSVYSTLVIYTFIMSNKT